MKKFKKLSALLISAVMVLATAVPAFAQQKDIETPADTDVATVNVSDVEPGLTVTAYKILEATYDDSGKNFRGYKAIEGLEIEKDLNNDGEVDLANLEEPTSEEITAIAVKINNGTLSPDSTVLTTYTANADRTSELGYEVGTYSADLTPGYYIIKVSGLSDDNERIYNPILAGVYYTIDENGKIEKLKSNMTYDGEADQNPVKDADGNYTEVEYDPIDASKKWGLFGEEFYAKSSPIEVVKEVYQNVDEDVATNQDTNPDAETNSKHGDDHDIGDTVEFRASATIPDYSAEYVDDSLVYNIVDTLEADKLAFRDEAGTEVAGNTWIKIGVGTSEAYTVEVTKNTEEYVYSTDPLQKFTVKFDGANKFTISLDPAMIRAHGGEKVYIAYYAELLEGAGTNFDENTNEIEVEFTNDPEFKEGGEPKTGKKKDITFHYTFELDGTLDGEEYSEGSQTKGKQSGHELAKVDENFDEATDRTITYTRQDGSIGTATLDDETGKYIDTETGDVAIDWDKAEFTEESWTNTVVKNGLEAAEFRLIPYGSDGKSKDEEKALSTTTNGGGRLNFRGLDAGYYVLEETKAPKGYSLNTNKTIVFIDADYYENNEYYDYTLTKDDITDEMYEGVDYDKAVENGVTVYKPIKFHKGELKSYEVKRLQMTEQDFAALNDDLTGASLDAGESTVYEETRTKTSKDDPVVHDIEIEVENAASTFIQNVKVPLLPSTGGMGTYLFTILGVAIIAVAACMLIFRKRKNEAE